MHVTGRLSIVLTDETGAGRRAIAVHARGDAVDVEFDSLRDALAARRTVPGLGGIARGLGSLPVSVRVRGVVVARLRRDDRSRGLERMLGLAGVDVAWGGLARVLLGASY